ncbi:RecX family transcriptional regulator [Candidatus Dojkabacteria bacterium]|uniref:Regulatory protein RecX n=1 Tax=Candidatus Dojkabacteria bacterium TaxID=2099670 RepID=A0A955IA35_9BACT|nr:RecX family transcriptional regulator [Candidatus Dojkabacteria bacterium]
MQITSIVQQKRNEDNVNLFLDNKFWCSISKDTLLEFQLHKGKTITQDQKQELEKLSSENFIKEKALKYIFIRPRSKKELYDYLVYKKDFEKESVEIVLTKLESKGTVNDTEFAKWFVSQRLISNKYGEQRIRNDLIKKGISKNLIDISLKELVKKDDQIEKIKELIKKFEKEIKEEDVYKKKQKITRRLLSRGFSYDDIKKEL